jgi:quinoprotein dehydrogenase-associated probable ABC transporter substrate-binding protein
MKQMARSPAHAHRCCSRPRRFGRRCPSPGRSASAPIPNNLPFSNQRGGGFENRLAEMIARDLNVRVSYTWWAQRRGFFRNTLNAGACDVVMGAPTGLGLLAASRPYYRSAYAFVMRNSMEPPLHSLDDPRLRRLRVGVHPAGDDGINPPPAHALAARGIVDNVAGYTLYGGYRRPNPPARLIEAVAEGRLDAAIAWGPPAGYFAARKRRLCA